ncbi:ribosome silencing factor [Anaerorhabdus sp.]|uniref:ribosome silencing factor n=1 Tax=Anaerorhabdus sp. TaxID=1872524 RepID=UPI002FCB084E
MSNKLLELITKTVDDRLGEDIVVLDFRNHNPFCDYFVIATALNHRMAKSIVDSVEEKVLASGGAIRALDGNEDSDWLLIDCYDVVVHIFVGAERHVYQLERLWGDLPKIEVQV